MHGDVSTMATSCRGWYFEAVSYCSRRSETWRCIHGESPKPRFLLPCHPVQLPIALLRALEPGALIAYSAKVDRHHAWLLSGDGASLSQSDTVMDWWYQSIRCLIAIPPLLWLVGIRSALEHIRHLRVWCTSGLAIAAGGHKG